MSDHDREPRRLALQAVVEIDRGVSIAMQEITAGRFMQARETLAVVGLLLTQLEAAIQQIPRPGGAS